MAKDLVGVSADYIFFCAYLADLDDGKAVEINGGMLQNFLDALSHTGAIKQLKRILLVNGLKQYGAHLGVPKQPMHETDPWLEGPGWPPNFYYTQQHILIDAAAKANGAWTWVVTYPQDVIGVAKANFMNLATALGLYCAVSKQLSGELPFPGSKASYLAFNCWTSANLHAKFCLWAVTAPNTGNQAFNVINGDTESWQNLWPRLAARFGCKIPRVMFPGGERGKYNGFEPLTIPLREEPPAAAFQDSMGLAGEFKQSFVHQQIDTTKWAQRPEVVQAWEQLRDKYKLDQQAWEKATWLFMTYLLGRDFSCVVSMSKARKFGWTGYQDTWDAFEETFKELEENDILPPAAELKNSGADVTAESK